jgi:hypothetical protein
MSEPSTYIKLNRNIQEWRWYKDIVIKSVFIDLLLNANIEDNDFEKITVHRGEIVTSYNSLAESSGITYKQARRAVQCLKKTKEVEVKRYSKFIVIKVLNYKKYQNKSSGEGNQKAITGQSEGNQRATIKEYKELKNLKEINKENLSCSDMPLEGAIEDEQSEWSSGNPEYDRWRNQ